MVLTIQLQIHSFGKLDQIKFLWSPKRKLGCQQTSGFRNMFSQRFQLLKHDSKFEPTFS